MKKIQFTYESEVTGDFEFIRVFAANIRVPHKNGKIKFQGEIYTGESMLITYRFVAPNGTDIIVRYTCTNEESNETYQDNVKTSPRNLSVKSGAFLEDIVTLNFD